MPAEERQTNGSIKPCCEALKRCLTAAVNSAEHWIPWSPSEDGEPLTIYVGISLYDSRLDVVLICHRLAKLGIDQLLTYASLCWRTRRLSLLSPPLLYAQLDIKL